ncbi:MAG: hypothetical protein RL497_2505 [Pseudomonadota bacterium]|jgi:hypothetical protein
MIKMAALINHCTDDFNQHFGARLQPMHRRALDAMLACKSQCGECLMACEHCNDQKWIALSCGHRACPQCQVNLARWGDNPNIPSCGEKQLSLRLYLCSALCWRMAGMLGFASSPPTYI